MKYEIIKDGKIMFQTDYEECLPPKEILKEMKNAGYILKNNSSSKQKGKGDKLSK